MNVDGKPYRTIWLSENGSDVRIIDQTRLPHEFCIASLKSLSDAIHAIRDMRVRGAPLIGITAAFGLGLAMRENHSNSALNDAANQLIATRPTAINLKWAVDELHTQLLNITATEREGFAMRHAQRLAEEDVSICSAIGDHGLEIIREIANKKHSSAPINILTHCNAGWLATADWGTALAPVYKAYDAGIQVHVWVDETRPRNQGASLTAWELLQHGVPHTVIVDNAGGHLMQHGMVDICITGTDRTTAGGDVCNKIGTYLKALAAHDNGIPFYVALPGPTIDWSIDDGLRDIPIEERDGNEVSHIMGGNSAGEITTVRLIPEGSRTANYAFDVTPRRYVTGLITEKGIALASRESLAALYLRQCHATLLENS